MLVPGPCPGLARADDGRVVAACDSAQGGVVHLLSAYGDPLVVPAPRVGDAIASVYENRFTIGCGDPMSSVRITADGRLLVAVVEGAEAEVVSLRALDGTADGPRFSIPGDAPGEDGNGGNGCRGFTVGWDGAILAWGYEGVELGIELAAARTEFMVYEPSGIPRRGWPRGSQGSASRPVFHDDGSVSYVSATGRLWRHERGGELAAGTWPYQLGGNHAPYAAPDGRIVVIDLTDAGPSLVSLDSDGRVTAGWPVLLPDAVETRCLLGDTPCVGSVEPLVTADGRAYVALATGSVVAIDRNGRVPSGWPARLGDSAHALRLTESGTSLVVRGVICPSDKCAESAVEATWTLDRAGRVSH